MIDVWEGLQVSVGEERVVSGARMVCDQGDITYELIYECVP